MKNKFSGIILCFVALFVSVVCTASCAQNSSENKNAMQTSAGTLLPPYVLSFGTYLYWQEIKNAAEYEIYAEDTYIKTVTETTYALGDVEKDCTYYVVAKSGSAKSKKSNTVNVSKNCNFGEDEIYDASVRSPDEIPSTVRKVILSGLHWTGIVLQQRTTDIIFEMHDAQFAGLNSADNVSSRFKADYNVIFEINGNCIIKGKDGYDGRSFGDSAYDDQCRDGYDGTDGGNGICVPTLIVRGSGNLTVTGGNGGNGGKGSAAKGLFNSNKPGKGSFGGNGGSALITEYLLLQWDDGCILDLTDGKGGKKGETGDVAGDILPGINTNIMQSLDNSYYIFTDGKSGQSSLGTKLITNGKINLNGEQI